jgi:hypothetical protein
VFEEKDAFDKLNANSITTTMTSNILEPVFNIGDIVGGVEVANRKFENEFLICSKDNVLHFY